MQTQKKEAAEASTDPERMLSLRMWGDAAKDVLHEAFVDCGWGRLIFGQTFAAPASLAAMLSAETEGERDIILYAREPHVLLAEAPQLLFLDPSHTYRLDFFAPPAVRQSTPAIAIRAARAEVDSVKRVVRLERVRINFQDPRHGRVEVRANRAEFLLDSDDFILRDQVEGSTAEGERFSTAQVRYEQTAQRLWTHHPVRLYRDGLVVQGEGMEIDLATRRIRLMGQVEARMERD